MKKRIIIISLVLTMALAGSAMAGSLSDVVDSIEGIFSETEQLSDSESSYEAAKTPEDAANLLIIGLANSDLDMAVAAFAVDQFAENVDAEKYIEFVGGMVNNSWIPNDVPYAYEINKAARLSDVYSQIKNFYNTLIENAYYSGENAGQMAAIGDMDVSDFVDSIFPIRNTEMEIEFGYEFIAPETLSDKYLLDSTQENMQKNCQWIGCDDMQSVVLSFECNDEQYYLLMDVIQYGEDWYVYNLSGHIGAICGLNAYSGGLAKLQQ